MSADGGRPYELLCANATHQHRARRFEVLGNVEREYWLADRHGCRPVLLEHTTEATTDGRFEFYDGRVVRLNPEADR